MAAKIPYQLEPQAADGILTQSKYIKGTYSVVNTVSERDTLPSGTTIEGSLVYVVSNKTTYRKTSTGWEVEGEDHYFYESIYDFPSVGTSNKLYIIITTGQIYYWAAANLCYKTITLSNKQFYGFITDSDGNILGVERQIDGGAANADYIINDFEYTQSN